jgi:hypothetical protein
MIPYCPADQVAVRPRRRFRLWIPLLLVWGLLLPFVLLLAPLVFVACLFVKVNPFRGVAVYWQLFNSFRGLRVEVEDPGARIRIT